MTPSEFARLHKILETPTAPFRESRVLALLTEIVEEAGAPWFLDPSGNLILGATSKREVIARVKKKTKEPLVYVIAHLDHPGFIGESWKKGNVLQAKWHGGSPTENIPTSPVWISNEEGQLFSGVVKRAVMEGEVRKNIQSLEISLDPASLKSKNLPKAETLFGGFRFRAPVWKEGPLYYTKAADDLVGAFVALTVFLRLWKKKSASSERIIVLLTRAEEVGFIGAIAHFELGWHLNATRPVSAMSLETSRALPGAEIGKGPVVRLGDRTGVFHAPYLRVLSEVAEDFLPGKHQRRIMDGGSCEATAAQAYGIPSVGISVPLGNYHNQSFEGGPDSRGKNAPAPEFIHEGDLRGMLNLLQGYLSVPSGKFSSPWKKQKKALQDRYLKLQALL